MLAGENDVCRVIKALPDYLTDRVVKYEIALVESGCCGNQVRNISYGLVLARWSVQNEPSTPKGQGAKVALLYEHIIIA